LFSRVGSAAPGAEFPLLGPHQKRAHLRDHPRAPQELRRRSQPDVHRLFTAQPTKEKRSLLDFLLSNSNRVRGNPSRRSSSLRGLMRPRARQVGQMRQVSRTMFSFTDLEMDMIAYRVLRNGRTIHLASTEFRLLWHLMPNPHRVYSRDELHAAWPRTVHFSPRTTFRQFAQRAQEAGGRDLIRTVRAVACSFPIRRYDPGLKPVVRPFMSKIIEGCSDGPSRASGMEDGPWGSIARCTSCLIRRS
jgi:hypothetical protein